MDYLRLLQIHSGANGIIIAPVKVAKGVVEMRMGMVAHYADGMGRAQRYPGVIHRKCLHTLFVVGYSPVPCVMGKWDENSDPLCLYLYQIFFSEIF